MSDFHSRKTIKTRKPHDCIYCNRRIGVGELAVYQTGKYEGNMYNHYMCLWCDNNVSNLETYGEGGSYEFEVGGLHERVGDNMIPLECLKCRSDDMDYDVDTHPDKECIDFKCQTCGHKYMLKLDDFFGDDSTYGKEKTDENT